MKLSKFLLVASLALIPAPQLLAQWLDEELEEVKLQEISPQAVRLTWAAVAPMPPTPTSCGQTITYSVFRGTDENFTASEETQIASELTVTHYIAHEPKGPTDYYYRVKAVGVPRQCTPPVTPPVLKSGSILTYPLDLGGQYTVTVGDKTEVCSATSTAELTCSTLPNFHAVLASQGSHEFLIGCLSSDYDDNNWSCVNLKLGAYSINVHSLTATILNAGFSKVNTRTGKGLGPIIPEFSVLSVLK
jgi:hypothetical protein